ncbi:acanthoscurrin-2-like [Contarinia nasturtii]|uniref:acanthoscurrin-2-like n=1 Tax=Contarinia nasturtii TaxID=265458 RepID=UPI0012D42B58|nr:acanthoscurrin-2-like [Contarinia nasturtii]
MKFILIVVLLCIAIVHAVPLRFSRSAQFIPQNSFLLGGGGLGGGGLVGGGLYPSPILGPGFIGTAGIGPAGLDGIGLAQGLGTPAYIG